MGLGTRLFERIRRLVPFMVFGMVILLAAPARNAPGRANGGDVSTGDGTGGLGADAGSIAWDCQRFILPIYPSNSEEWDRAVASKMPRGSILILNQAGTRAGDDPYAIKGGPGFEADSDLQARVAEAQERGYIVIGYIRTGETGSNSGPRRDRERTDREIADLKEWYGVDGIFYDEVWADERYLDYYTDLVAHGRATIPGMHVINAGAAPSDAYASLADVIGTFEGTNEDFHSWSPEPWQLAFPPSKWAAAVMSVADAMEMRKIIWLSRMDNLGYIYVTNRFGTQFENPWTHLPAYWPALVARLGSCDSGLTDEPSP